MNKDINTELGIMSDKNRPELSYLLADNLRIRAIVIASDCGIRTFLIKYGAVIIVGCQCGKSIQGYKEY